MSRYKIVIQYDGTNFSGFQSQKNQSGIQDNIESSISKLNNDKKIKIYGASRTDAVSYTHLTLPTILLV